MAKISSRQIIKSVKEKERLDEKTNITFRLNEALISQFRGKCKKEKVSMASVMEALMKDFITN